MTVKGHTHMPWLTNSTLASKEMKDELAKIKKNFFLLWTGEWGGSLIKITYICSHFKEQKWKPVLEWEDVLKPIKRSVKINSPYKSMRVLSVLTKTIQAIGIPTFGMGHDYAVFQIARIVGKLINQFSNQHIFNKDLMITYEEVQKIARALFSCHSNLVVALSALQYTNSSYNLNIVYRPKPISHNTKFGYLLKKSGARFRREVLQRSLSNKIGSLRSVENVVYMNLKKLANMLSHSLVNFMDSLVMRLLPMERAFLFHNDNYTVYTRVDNPRYFVFFSRLPLQSSKSYIKSNHRLGEELYEMCPFVKFQVVILDENLFWWDRDQSAISTQLIFTVIQTIYNKTVVRHVDAPLDLFLSVKSMESLQVYGSVFQPDPSEMKDFSVTVYRVTPPLYGSSGKLFVIFNQLNSKHLRVALTSSVRPDYAYMTSYAVVVTENSSEVSLNYHLDDKDSFLYIGIMLAKALPPKESINFTFETYVVRCLIRLHSMWVTEHCIVANETSRTLVHCKCQVVALVGAGIDAPSVQLAPIVHFKYFRDKEFNTIPLLSVVIFTVCLGVLCIWAHCRDKQNRLKDKVVVLDDNFPGEEWAYLLGIYTGIRFSSGTSSNVGIQLIGELAESRTHILRSKKHKTLQTCSEDWFIIFSAERLGNIKSIRLWLDYTGRSPSWYCRKVIVYDCSVHTKYMFRLGMWFYVSLNSDMVEVQVSPEPTNHFSFFPVLIDNLICTIQEKSWIVSIVKHHPRSFVTLTETVVAFFTTIAFIGFLILMHYKYDNGGVEDYPYYHLSLWDLWVGTVYLIPAAPVSILAHFLFKHKVMISHLSIWKLGSRERHQTKGNRSRQDVNEDDYREQIKNDRSEVHDKAEQNLTVLDKLRAIRAMVSVRQLPITMLHDSADQVQVTRRSLYIAWVVVPTVLCVFSLLSVLEGIGMAVIKSLIWLNVTLVTIVVGLTISNLLRILPEVFLTTLITKKQYDEPVFACDPKLGLRLDLVGDKAYLDKLLSLRAQPEYHPLRHFHLAEIRTKQGKNLFWHSVLDMAITVLIYGLVSFIAMNIRTATDYYTTKHLKDLMEYNTYRQSPCLVDVENLKDLREYLKSTLSYNYCRKTWYNGMELSFPGDKFPETGWVMDFTSRMIGVIQLRQKRTHPENCMPQLLRHLFPKWMCIPPLTDSNDDTNNYTLGWGIQRSKRSDNKDENTQWRYDHHHHATSHFGASGQEYSSGGYMLNLGRTAQDTITVLWKMEEANWFNKLTQVIFINSCVYNPNTNTISIISTCVEIKQTIGIDHKIRVVNIAAQYDFFSVEILWLVSVTVILLFLATYVIKSVIQRGKAYFFSFWNVLDFCIMILLMVSLVTDLSNVLQTVFSLQNHLSTGQKNLLVYSTSYNYYLLLINIFLSIFCTVKLFKHCIRTIQVTPFVNTLRLAWPHISKVMILVLPMMYLQFNVIDSLLFNSQVTSNRIPLVNKVGLGNYAKQYIFPNDKFVPYLFCQFSFLVIVLLEIIIAHHYRIGKNKTIIISNSVDIFHNLREKLRNQKEKPQLRLRGGADLLEKSSFDPQQTMSTIGCLAAILQQSAASQNKECDFQPMKNFINWKIKSEKVTEVVKNIDSKMDRMIANLKSFHECL